MSAIQAGLVNNRDGFVIGYKYFDFGQPLPGQKTTFTVQLRDGATSGQMEVWLGDPDGAGAKIGAVVLEKAPAANAAWREITIPVGNIGGRHALYFKFSDGERDAVMADVRSFVFTRDTP